MAVAVAPPGGPSAGDVYVGDYHEVGAGYGSVEVYSEDLLVPTVSPQPEAEVKPSGVSLKGTVNPEKLTVTSCVFEYGETTSYGKTVACEPSVTEISKGLGGTDEGPVPVTAELPVGPGGLSPGTTLPFPLGCGRRTWHERKQ